MHNWIYIYTEADSIGRIPPCLFPFAQDAILSLSLSLNLPISLSLSLFNLSLSLSQPPSFAIPALSASAGLVGWATGDMTVSLLLSDELYIKWSRQKKDH